MPMKTKLRLFTLLALCLSTNSYALLGDGWSSSGGGELGKDINNPWFWQNYQGQVQPKTWCILHGGEKNFSLSQAQAKKEIEYVLTKLTTNIKNRFGGPLAIGKVNGVLYEVLNKDTLSMAKDKRRLATDFEYQSQCQDKTDLKFYLGVERGDEYDALTRLFPTIKAKKAVAMAVRTEYSFPGDIQNPHAKEIGGKGIIWLTPDKGTNSYLGERNLFHNGRVTDFDFTKTSEIWNSQKMIQTYGLGMPTGFKEEQIVEGVFASIILHELGHVYGLQHLHNDVEELRPVGLPPIKTHFVDRFGVEVMDEKFPVYAVKVGFVPKRVLENFYRSFSLNMKVSSESSTWDEVFDQTGINADVFRVAKRVKTYKANNEFNYAIYQYPNSLKLKDTETSNLFANAYGVEFEYGFGNFQNYGSHNHPDGQGDEFYEPEVIHNYPAKLKILQINRSPVPYISYGDLNDEPSEDFKYILQDTLILQNIDFSDSLSNVVTFNHFVFDIDFYNQQSELLRNYEPTMTFTTVIGNGVVYLGTMTKGELKLINSQTGEKSSIKLEDTLYQMRGPKAVSKPFPHPLFL